MAVKRGDPYIMNAKRNGDCSGCKDGIKRGQEIIYWPATRAVYHLACGEADYKRFLLDKQDEEMMGGAG